MEILTLVSTKLQCFFKWLLKSRISLSSWSLGWGTDKKPWVSSKGELAWRKPKCAGIFWDPEQSQHQRQCMEGFNLRKNGFNTVRAVGIFVLAETELKSNTQRLQSKWLINRHGILLLLHNTLKKMDGFYYSTYYFLSEKVKKNGDFFHSFQAIKMREAVWLCIAGKRCNCREL